VTEPRLIDTSSAAVQTVLEALRQYSAEQQLEILGQVWLTIADRERTEALDTPGGFSQARASQMERLIRLIELVSSAEPDGIDHRHPRVAEDDRVGVGDEDDEAES
jgi:hypothetical protein